MVLEPLDAALDDEDFDAAAPPTREVDDRIPADMPPGEEPPLLLAEALVDTTAALVAPAADPDEDESLPPPPPPPLPPDEAPPPPPPPEVPPPPRLRVLKLEPSERPPDPRVPRNCGVKREEYFSGPVWPVRRIVFSRRPPL